MTDIEINEAIAKACGWTRIWDSSFRQWTTRRDDGQVMSIEPDPDATWEVHLLPDYANDLNAMSKAEKTLTDEQYSSLSLAANEDVSFVGWLFRIMVRRMENPNFRTHSASARQRAEAFLRVLNLWEESK